MFTEIHSSPKSLAITHPEIAKEWHPTKNGDLKPTDVMAGCGKKVWWYLPYDDPRTGKHFEFEWEQAISARKQGLNCPFLNGRRLYQGFNDLATIRPDLAAQWHPAKNGTLTPQDITYGSRKRVWWLYPYDDPVTGKHFDFEWQSSIAGRSQGKGCCPFVIGNRVWIGFNDLATTHPDLAAEWHPTRNGKLTPKNVTAGSEKKVWWLLRYNNPKTGKQHIFEWKDTILNRKHGAICPHISFSKIALCVFDILKENNIIFLCETIFDDLKDQKPLPFDVYTQNKCIIEIDGEQHFKTVNKFGGKEGFKTRIYHDNLKNQYCADNNIPILRIPYVYDTVVDKEKIEQFVLDFNKTYKIPQEILDFYSQFGFSNYITCVEKIAQNKKIKEKIEITENRLQLPEKNNNSNKVFDYLTQKCCFPVSLVNDLLKNNVIYEDINNNCVFYYEDTNHRQIFVQQNIPPNKKLFIVNSSYHNGYWAFINENIKNVFVFETPLEAIAFKTLYNTPGVYCSMNGFRKHVFSHIVDDFPNSEIYFCSNWVKSGNEFYEQYCKGYKRIVPKGENKKVEPKIKNIEFYNNWNQMLETETWLKSLQKK